MVTGQEQAFPKCDQDWLRDDEVLENRKVTIIYCFGFLDLVLCFDMRHHVRGVTNMMYTKYHHYDAPLFHGAVDLEV